MPFLRQSYKQKPQAFGPVSAVQASIFKNAERIGIDPASIALAMPMWGPGNQIDYAKSYSAINYNAVFSKNRLTFDGTNSYLSLSPNPSKIANNYTLIVCAKIKTGADNDGIISGSAGGIPKDGIFGVLSGGTQLFYQTIASTSPYISGNFSKDTDSSFFVTVDKTNNGKIYQNKTLVASGLLASIVGDSTQTFIGGYTFSSNKCPMDCASVFKLSTCISNSQIASLSDNPYYLLQRVAPVYYSVPGGAITITTSLDGKVIIRTTTSALLDCMASIKNNAINFLDCAAAVSTTKTDAIDGKTILKSVAAAVFDSKTSVLSVASLLLDGKAIVSDTGYAILDVKGTVKDSAYDLVDGKSIIKSTNTAILDGKLIFLSTGNSVIDGKIIVNAERFSSSLLDGKTIIKSVVTNYLDGLIYIGNAADKNIDGKAIIKSDVCLTIDGKTTIQDVASNLLDGSASILTSIANIVDGKIIISDAAIGLLDGEAVILDDSSIILDGKVFLSSGSEINIFDGKITLSVPIVGKVTVSFSMRSPSVSFAIRTPAATVSIN